MARSKKQPGDRTFVEKVDERLVRRRAPRRPAIGWREKLEQAVELRCGCVLLGEEVRALVAEWNALCDAANAKRPQKP